MTKPGHADAVRAAHTVPPWAARAIMDAWLRAADGDPVDRDSDAAEIAFLRAAGYAPTPEQEAEYLRGRSVGIQHRDELARCAGVAWRLPRNAADAACTEVERLRAERDAAEGRVLPPRWNHFNSGFDRDASERPDLIFVRVVRGIGKARPFALIVRSDLATEQIAADTVLAAIEAAEAWLARAVLDAELVKRD